MNLRQGLILAVAAAAGLAAAVVLVVGRFAVRERFDAAEQSEALERAAHVRHHLQRRIRGIYEGLQDWAIWDSAWEYAKHPETDSPWVQENVVASFWQGKRVDTLAIIAPNGRAAVAWGWDIAAARPTPPPKDIDGIAARASAWMASPDGGYGLVRAGDRVLMAAIHPIQRSDGSNPSRGWMLMARRIDDEVLRDLAEDSRVRQILAETVPQRTLGPDAVSLPSEQEIEVDSVYADSDGQPVITLRVASDRSLHRRGIEAHAQLIWVALFGAVVCAVVAVLLVERLVVRRLVGLGRELAAIAGSADHGRRVAEQGSSEIRDLAQAINATLTSLEEANRCLAEDAEQRRSLIAAMPDRLLVVAPDGTCLPVGGAVDGSDSSWSGGNLTRLLPPTILPRVLELVAAAGRGERGIVQYHQERHGRVKHHEMRLFPFAGGRALAVVRDITVRVEDELRLQRVTAAAESASRAKTAFLANLSHELRSPLNGIIGMSTLLQADQLADDARERVEVVQACAEDLLALINQLLDLSKVEAERMELVEELFSPIDLAHHVVEALAPRAHAKGVEVVLICASSLPHRLRGDAGRLRQVLTNLVANAVKFTERGEVVVRISAMPDGEGWSTLHAAITDSGPGIAADVVERLFRPFEQGDAQIARRYGGTGLGLAISKSLVELMGGTITVSSELGRGSEFSFTARLGNASAVAPATEDAIPADLHRCSVLACGPAQFAAITEALRPIGIGVVRENDVPGELVMVDVDSGADAVPDGRPCVLLVGPRWRGESGAGRAVVRKPMHPRRLREAVCAAWFGEAPVTAPANRKSSSCELAAARILVVDDQAVNRAIAVGHLQMLGLVAEGEGDAAKAVERVLAGGWDLVLMDCRMPGVDGFEATRRIREGERGRRTPIIALTAAALAGDREQCLEAGMDDHLAKPLRMQELQAILLRWLGQASRQQPATEKSRRSLSQRLERLRSEAGPEAVSEGARALLEAAPQLLQCCAAALAAGDAAALVDAAHTLKGDAAAFGLDELAESASILVEAGRARRLEGADAHLTAAGHSWRAAEELLRRMV